MPKRTFITDRMKASALILGLELKQGDEGPRSIADQIMALAKIFNLEPKQALEYAKNLPELPKGAKEWFTIPTVDALAAKHFPEVTDSANKYCRAVQLVHAKLAESRRFRSWREEEITPNRLRVHAHTALSLDLIAENQPGDILIIGGQLGTRYQGESAKQARETFVSNEFGLDSLAVGSILLIHPERLVSQKDLNIECPGDEFFPCTGDNGFSDTSYYLYRGGRVEFSTKWRGDPNVKFGSASGFIPKS